MFMRLHSIGTGGASKSSRETVVTIEINTSSIEHFSPLKEGGAVITFGRFDYGTDLQRTAYFKEEVRESYNEILKRVNPGGAESSFIELTRETKDIAVNIDLVDVISSNTTYGIKNLGFNIVPHKGFGSCIVFRSKNFCSVDQSVDEIRHKEAKFFA